MASIEVRKAGLNLELLLMEANTLKGRQSSGLGTSTSFSVRYTLDGVVYDLKFTGTGLTYTDSRYVPSGGTVTGLTYIRGGEVQLQITNALMEASRIQGFLYSDNADGAIGEAFTLGDTVTGTTGNERLIGLDGDDTLDGKAGMDRMWGGSGNDTYIIDNAGDQIWENGSPVDSGADVARTSVNYTLGWEVSVEYLQTTNVLGRAALVLNGNGLGQTITGNAGANVLRGMGGADTIKGGAGNDVVKGDGNAASGQDGADTVLGGAGSDSLYGGGGNDILRGDDTAAQRGSDKFYFDTAPGSNNRDTILDFNPADDSIYLKKSGVFAGIAAVGELSAGAFKQINYYRPEAPGVRTSVTDDYRIIYDKVSGKLYYDADGHGGSVTAILFATVNDGAVHPTLTSADFIVF